MHHRPAYPPLSATAASRRGAAAHRHGTIGILALAFLAACSGWSRSSLRRGAARMDGDAIKMFYVGGQPR